MTSWVEGVWAVGAVLAAWGCGVGALFGVMNLLVVDYMGLNNVLPFFSVCGVINCVWLLVFSPLFGKNFIMDAPEGLQGGISGISQESLDFRVRVYVP